MKGNETESYFTSAILCSMKCTWAGWRTKGISCSNSILSSHGKGITILQWFILCIDWSVCGESLETRIQLIWQRFLSCLNTRFWSIFWFQQRTKNQRLNSNAAAFIMSYFSWKYHDHHHCPRAEPQQLPWVSLWTQTPAPGFRLPELVLHSDSPPLTLWFVR